MMLPKQQGGFEAAFSEKARFRHCDVSEKGRERKTAAAADVLNLPCAVIKQM